jgi:protoheme IX farnesyltransferase
MLQIERPPVSARLRGYVALTKPRIIELLLITTVPTMVVAEEGLPSLWLVVATVIGGTLSAGGANAINMYIDRDIDAIMERTQRRPLVTGVLTPRSAIIFAIGLEAFAIVWLAVFVNLLSAVLALGACLFYVFIYTLWLKRTSTQNIVIGGAAGAAPVLIGWSAVTDSLAWEPWLLFGVIFFWTPPHFWALAVRYDDDYRAANVPMLPSVADEDETVTKIIRYSVVMVIFSFLFGIVAGMGLIYWAVAVLGGGLFCAMAVSLRRHFDPKTAMRLFHHSITYLTVLFLSLAVDQLVRTGL